jgi:FixJ family two-component response regulator
MLSSTSDQAPHSPTVFVVDDDLSVRRALNRLLLSAGLRVLTFSSASEFFSGRGPEAPGCLLLDLRLPEISGLELLKSLRARDSILTTVLISAHGSIPVTVDAMKLGAVDFLTKPFDDCRLLDVVAAALSRSAARWRERQELAALRARYDTLTRRQREVCELVSRGLLNKQIAGELGTSEKTIKVHRAGVMTKMQVGSVAELVRLVDRLAARSRPEFPADDSPSSGATAWPLASGIDTLRSVSCA